MFKIAPVQCISHDTNDIYFFLFSDIFTLVSDNSGHLSHSKFDAYLKEVLALPTVVFEGPSFGYNETAGRACFDGVCILM